MKKALGQTVRDLKRGVNKKVLKVPGIERKVLDATSNDSWGPHGSHLAEISQASRNSTEFQMIIGVLWKRLSDTGKNWRHVHKALIVLEYLVANGSERVIDEIKEHVHQISTLSEFQYVDSSGRDQGSNVRRKSQSLVLLVSDKERIQEVRQKASGSRDKFGNSGVPPRPGGYGERYEENRNGYGKDDRYGKYGDASSRDGDHSDRDSETRYSRDGSVDDEYHGRSRNVDDQHFGTRNRSSERDSNHTADDDGYSSSRGSNVKGDDNSQDGRHGNQRYSDKNPGDPSSYEEAVSEGHSSVHSERGGDQTVPANRPTSPPVISNPIPALSSTEQGTSKPPVDKGPASYDEFDPRSSTPAPAVLSNSCEVDLLGSFFEPSNDSAKMLTSSATNSEVHNQMNSGSGGTHSQFSTDFDQRFEDPFGDTPFRATPSTETDPSQMHNFQSLQSTMNQGIEPPQAQSVAPQTDGHSNFGYGTPFGDVSFRSSGMSHDQFSSANMQLVPQGFHDEETDILAGILPPIGFKASPSTAALEPPAVSPGQIYESSNVFESYNPHSGPMPPETAHVSHQSPNTHPSQSGNGLFLQQGFTSLSQPQSNCHIQPNEGDFFQQLGLSMGTSAASNGQMEPSSHAGGYIQPIGSMVPVTSSMASGSSNGANMQHNANGCLPQQPNPSLGSLPMAPQGKNEPSAQSYNEGFLQQSTPVIPEAPHTTANAPNAYHQGGGFFQQGDLNIAPHGQKEQNSQNYNDGFLHQHSISTAPGGHVVPESSYLSNTQQNSGDILQQSGSLPGNSLMNPQQSGSPLDQNEQNPQTYNTGFFHQLSATTAPGTSVSSCAPQQNSIGFLQQSGYASQNSPMPAQQPGSMHMAPRVQKEQNTQIYNGGFLHQQPALEAPGSPSMAPGSSYASNAQQPGGAAFMQQPGGAAFMQQPGSSLGNYHLNPHGQTEPTAQTFGGGFLQQKQTLQMAPGQSYAPTGQYNSGNLHQSAGSPQFSTVHTETAPYQNGLGSFISQRGPSNQITSQPSVSTTAGPLALVPQPSKDKFETKSTVWKDTLSRGLVNLNISGSKTNPLSDIGIDFDAINRKEKRMEKSAATQAVSTITMGKAMGSGSGIGRAGATALRPSASLMMNTGTNTGVRSGPGFGPGPGMAGYGGMNQPPMGNFGGISQPPMGNFGGISQPPMGNFGGMNQQPMGGFGGMNQQPMGGYGGMNQQYLGGSGKQPMGMVPGAGMSPGMGMNMGQGNNMQQPTDLPQGSPYNCGFKPMASGGYPSQQPYGGGYR